MFNNATGTFTIDPTFSHLKAIVEFDYFMFWVNVVPIVISHFS